MSVVVEPSDVWDLEKLFFYLPNKTDKAVRRIVAQLDDAAPCKEYQLNVLRIIYYNDGISQKEISEHISFDKSRVSTIVKELVYNEWVEDTGEGRSSSLHLTKKGIRITKKGVEYSKIVFEKLISGFNQEERETMKNFYLRFDQYLDGILSSTKRF